MNFKKIFIIFIIFFFQSLSFLIIIFYILLLMLYIKKLKFLPIYDPEVALESTQTITPCLNLKAKVVVP